MLERLIRSPSKCFLVLLAAFAGGAALHAFDERVWLPAGWFAALAAPPAAAAVFAGGRRTLRLAGAGLVLLILGIWRYDAALAGLDRPGPLSGENTRFTGTVAEEPRQGIKGTILIMDRVFISGSRVPLSGRMRLSLYRPDAGAGYGDELAWICGPRPIGSADAAGLTAELLLRRLAWQCAPREPPAVLAAGRPGAFRTALLELKKRLRREAGALLPEPEASFLLGLLIGERQGLPPELADAFRQTGTSHILAVSGYNVTRLIDIFFILCAGAALRRRRAALIVSAGILAFAAIVGGEASVVRAAIMGCASLLAVLFARRYDGTAALLTAAAAMLAANPFILRHDVGFQLSFAAVWGLHAFGRPLTGKLNFLPEFLGVRQMAGETLAATIATLPVILHAFGRLPLIGPAANLLVLPLVPWAMALGALSLAAGALWPPAGLASAWFCTLILRLIEQAVRSAAALPLTVALEASPLVTAFLSGWVILLWFALNRAKPVVLTRRPSMPDIDIEVIDHGQI